MSKKTHHVVPAPTGGWSVVKGGATRASRVFETKEAAESYGRKLSSREQSELVIHKRDGTVESKSLPARNDR